MRESGILMPVSSLASNYGIGCFSKEAYEFVDKLKKAGQHYWQILPLGPTGYGDSPYQSFSTFAGNPYFIDLETLIEKGLLSKEECAIFSWGENPAYVDYEEIYHSRYKILHIAFLRSGFEKEKSYKKFFKENEFWLKEYALYTALKAHFKEQPWIKWEKDIRMHKKTALKKYEKLLKDEMRFVYFQQYEFQMQWKKLKAYANKNKVKIIGDIPIYVAYDSADAWANKELFQLDEKGNPTAVAGCPPDAFAATGQLWGNPLYRWEKHKETGYDWWISRVAYSLKLYDVVRIDHFRGFDSYYTVPFRDKTAEHGTWEQGPGIDLFRQITKRLGKCNIIAEDLGMLTDSVYKLLRKSGYPGMKVLEFAFDPNGDSEYLPHNYPKNCVVYTGTHDNEPLASWAKNLGKEERKFAQKYMNLKDPDEETFGTGFLRLAMASCADLCIIPMQDWMLLDETSRMNTPSTLGMNWQWRLLAGQDDEAVWKKIRKMTKLYRR